MTGIETTQHLLTPHPNSFPRETLTFLFFTTPIKWEAEFPSVLESLVWIPISLPLPALEAPAHISRSKAKESALTLRISPEYLGRGWEIWQWGDKEEEMIIRGIRIPKHITPHEWTAPRSPGKRHGDRWGRFPPCSLSSDERCTLMCWFHLHQLLLSAKQMQKLQRFAALLKK